MFNIRSGAGRTGVRVHRASRTLIPLFLLAGLCVPAGARGENRAIDGSGNNLAHPAYGQAGTQLIRKVAPAYADGVSAPSGPNRPNPREISNMVVSQSTDIPDKAEMTNWVWQWGQFIDHDLTLVDFASPREPMPIPIPAGDRMFDPQGTGAMFIPFDRSFYDPQTGTGPGNPRQQVNILTAFIDGSGVYGSDPERAAWLRTGEGGRLKIGEDGLLPYNDGTQLNVGPGNQFTSDPSLFVAGDIRANEQAGLTAIHTLFLREHNRLADELATAHPDWSDEELYQRARKIVGAVIQVITYHEFLPALLGSDAPDPDDAEYDPTINPGIANVFAAACYRVGHTMLPPALPRMDNDGNEMPEGPLPLRDAFFDPVGITEAHGIEPLLKGLASGKMQQIDNMVIDDVRNFLFGQPGQGGFDLACLNIQRGRDHGLPDYNTVREGFGLPRVTSFEEINATPYVYSRLAFVYESVDDIDVWVGALCETPRPGSAFGDLLTAVIVDQFTRLRDGDRFWYAHDPAFSAEEIAELERTRLSHVIRRNTPITKIQEDVFHMAKTQQAAPATRGLCGAMGVLNLGLSLGGLMLLKGRGRRGGTKANRHGG